MKYNSLDWIIINKTGIVDLLESNIVQVVTDVAGYVKELLDIEGVEYAFPNCFWLAGMKAEVDELEKTVIIFVEKSNKIDVSSVNDTLNPLFKRVECIEYDGQLFKSEYEATNHLEKKIEKFFSTNEDAGDDSYIIHADDLVELFKLVSPEKIKEMAIYYASLSN